MPDRTGAARVTVMTVTRISQAKIFLDPTFVFKLEFTNCLSLFLFFSYSFSTLIPYIYDLVI